MRTSILLLLCFIGQLLLNGCGSHESMQKREHCLYQEKLNPPIVFSRLTGEYWQVWCMNPDGSCQRQLTVSPSDKRYPTWLTIDEVVYRDNNNQVFKLNVDTGQEQRILAKFGRVGMVVPSFDCNKLIFVRFRSELKDSSDLWIVTSDGLNQQLLTSDVGLQYDPCWSNDFKKIVYVSGHGYQTHELFMLDIESSKKVRLSRNNALEVLPAISPDGSELIYSSDETGDFEIWKAKIDGKAARPLTNSNNIDTRPVWSPDGSSIMFVSGRSGSLQLWLMRADGSSLEKLTDGDPCMDPSWRIN